MKKANKKKIIAIFKTRKGIIAIFLIVFLLSALVWKVISDRGRVSSIDFSSELENRINRLVSGSPIEEMVPFIAKQDRMVASFLIAIAKKESNWGKYSPQKNGKNCYNYWGYRGTYNQTDSGYSCFDSPEQAVIVVGGRLKELVDHKIDNPKKMVIVWKCGWDCSGHGYWNVKKWEWDVGYYFKKIYN